MPSNLEEIQSGEHVDVRRRRVSGSRLGSAFPEPFVVPDVQMPGVRIGGGAVTLSDERDGITSRMRSGAGDTNSSRAVPLLGNTSSQENIP